MFQYGSVHVSRVVVLKTFCLTFWRASSMREHSYSKLNVIMNPSTNFFEFTVPCHNFVSRYKFIIIISKVWKTHVPTLVVEIIPKMKCNNKYAPEGEILHHILLLLWYMLYPKRKFLGRGKESVLKMSHKSNYIRWYSFNTFGK